MNSYCTSSQSGRHSKELIDIRILREEPEKIRDNLEKRNMRDFPFDELLETDLKRRRLITQNQKLKEERNKMSAEIAELKKKGEDAHDLIERMRDVSERIQQNEVEIASAEKNLHNLLLRLPNFLDPEVPIGPDDSANKEIRRWGSINENLKIHHVEVAENLDLLDTERAAKVAGSRFYFLKRDLVRLNFALITYGLDFLKEKGFVLLQPPFMLKREAIAGAVMLSDFEDVIYKIQDEDLYLIGTSEHAIAAMHMGEILDARQLPLRYAGISPCFRKEAGAHGKDTKGIFRVHQFEKVEQFVLCEPERSEEEHRFLLSNAEQFMQSLGIPYRVVLLSSGDMGKVASKTFDIESWMPAQGRYRELISCSNCTDFQARALGIKYRPKPHEESIFLHTLNSTLVATERTLVAIIENYYQSDAKAVSIPKALRPYMNGMDSIVPVDRGNEQTARIDP
jgi:seryl-tRNA synthetase